MQPAKPKTLQPFLGKDCTIKYCAVLFFRMLPLDETILSVPAQESDFLLTAWEPSRKPPGQTVRVPKPSKKCRSGYRLKLWHHLRCRPKLFRSKCLRWAYPRWECCRKSLRRLKYDSKPFRRWKYCRLRTFCCWKSCWRRGESDHRDVCCWW